MKYSELTSDEIGRLAPHSIALQPVAAMEQHGPHLPVVTDTALVTEIAERAEAALPGQAIILPTLWAGCSHHHLAFPGTISIASETYIRIIVDLSHSLLRSGFRKVLFLNGHGGNTTPLAEALYRLSLENHGAEPPWIVSANYWKLGERALADQQFMETPRLSHACEYETSMMLSLCGESVKMEKAQGHRTLRGSKFYDPLNYEPSLVTVCETFTQMTNSGAMGNPEKATAEKGDRLLASFTQSLVDFLTEFSTWEHQRPNAS